MVQILGYLDYLMIVPLGILLARNLISFALRFSRKAKGTASGKLPSNAVLTEGIDVIAPVLRRTRCSHRNVEMFKQYRRSRT